MTLVVVKVNEHPCRAVIATNFSHSFCGSALVRALKLDCTDVQNAPNVTTSDGTPIEFLGQAMVLLELGPWISDGLMPMLVAWDCPADVLIGEDLIKEIGKKYPMKFEFYKNAVNIGGQRVSMLDPLASEEKFISVVVMDPRKKEEIGLESWKKGNKEKMVPGALVKRRVSIKGNEDMGGQGMQSTAGDSWRKRQEEGEKGEGEEERRESGEGGSQEQQQDQEEEEQDGGGESRLAAKEEEEGEKDNKEQAEIEIKGKEEDEEGVEQSD